MSDYPLIVWHYRLRLGVSGADKQNLPDALEAEDLALFSYLPRQEAYGQIREGLLAFDVTLDQPLRAFPQDLSVLSLYLFTIVKGFEVSERFVAEGESDDARAWKVVARQGEWVKVPLCVQSREDGTFHVDEGADDLEVISAHWTDYPRWFQDGMRRQYPTLRDL